MLKRPSLFVFVSFVGRCRYGLMTRARVRCSDVVIGRTVGRGRNEREFIAVTSEEDRSE